MSFSIEMQSINDWSARELIEWLQSNKYDTDQHFVKIFKSPHSKEDLYLEIWTDNLDVAKDSEI